MGRVVKLSVLTCLVCISVLAKGQKKNIIYADSSISKIEVEEVDTLNEHYTEYTSHAVSYSKILINYGTYNHPNTKDYIAEKTVDMYSPSGMKDYCHIKVKLIPINDNTAQPFTMEDTCDDMILNEYFYSTVFYGCCGGQNVTTYYDYKSNRKICQGQPDIISYQTPNHNFKCYVGYTIGGYWPEEGVSPNTLTIAYNTGETYKVIIKDTVRDEHFIQKISFVTNNPKNSIVDSYSENLVLSSLDGIKSINQINNLKIVLSLYIDQVGEKDIEIPIINGKPFGKDIASQTIEMPK